MKCLSRSLPVLLLALLSASCTSQPAMKHHVPKGTVTHVVILWLNDRGDETARQEVLSAAKRLREISEVTSVTAGSMLPSDRAVVDSSYDIAMVITLKSEKALEKYLNDPLHQELKRNVLDRYVRKYQVYDFVAGE